MALKPGFHACVSRTHHGARCVTMYEHQYLQASQAVAINACMLSTKSHMLNFCEACAARCCYCDLWEPITPNKKTDFYYPKKRSKAQNKKYNNDFRTVVVSNSIPDALCDLNTSKYKRPRNKPNDVCLWKPAKTKQSWRNLITLICCEH